MYSVNLYQNIGFKLSTYVHTCFLAQIKRTKFYTIKKINFTFKITCDNFQSKVEIFSYFGIQISDLF